VVVCGVGGGGSRKERGRRKREGKKRGVLKKRKLQRRERWRRMGIEFWNVCEEWVYWFDFIVTVRTNGREIRGMSKGSDGFYGKIVVMVMKNKVRRWWRKRWKGGRWWWREGRKMEGKLIGFLF